MDVVRVNVQGLRDVMASDGMRDVLREYGEDVAARARTRGVTVGQPEQPIPVEVTVGRKRYPARVWVSLAHASGLAVEAKHRLLGGALG